MNTDLAGYAGFNEVFPYLNWLVVDTDSARYKQTGVHVVYDAGGAADCGAGDTNLPCPHLDFSDLGSCAVGTNTWHHVVGPDHALCGLAEC